MKKIYIGKHCRGRNIMPKFKNIENRKNITYKLACNEGKLISKDKKILNVAKKIKKDASVVKELKKLDKIEEILMVEIVRKCEGRKERLTLLQQALLYSHKSTLEYVMKGAEEYKLFEKISGKRIVSEHLGDHGEIISRTYSTVVCENGAVHKKTLKSRRKSVKEKSRTFDIPGDVEEVKDSLDVGEYKEDIIDKTTETDTQSHKDINKDKEDFHLTFENKEKAETEVLLPKEKMVPTRRLIKVDWSLLNEEDIDNLNPTTTEHTKEKAMSTRRLIKVDWSLLNEEDIDNLNPITTEHTKEKAQNSSIKTAVQERDIFGSFPFQQSFNGDSVGKEETPSTKAMQQKQAIVAGSAGIVLLVGSIVSYILKMHIIAVVVGIVGLACISFALYSNLKPDTKLEKLEGPVQPVIVHSHLNPT